METLDADLKSLKSRVISLEENIQKEAELLRQLDTFLQVVLIHTHTSRAAVGVCVCVTSEVCVFQDASSCVGALCGRWQQLQQEGVQLGDFFCEDPQAFRLDDCFSVLSSFCSRFGAAVKVAVLGSSAAPCWPGAVLAGTQGFLKATSDLE